MKHWTNVLEHPESYSREDLDDAIRFLWPLLFPEYALRDPRSFKGLGDWNPHIFAERDVPLTFIVAKVRRDLARSDAIRHLKQQVAIFHEHSPMFPVYPIIFGPWDQEDFIEILEPDQPGDYEVATLRVQELVGPIRTAASHVLRQNEEYWQEILGIDWTRLPPEARYFTETELFFWLLNCPVSLVSEGVRNYLAINLSEWEPQEGRTQDTEGQGEGTGSDKDHSGSKP